MSPRQVSTTPSSTSSGRAVWCSPRTPTGSRPRPSCAAQGWRATSSTRPAPAAPEFARRELGPKSLPSLRARSYRRYRPDMCDYCDCRSEPEIAELSAEHDEILWLLLELDRGRAAPSVIARLHD